MRTSSLISLLLALPMASAFAQTPDLQTNVVYVCKDGQSFKVFSCNSTTGACDYQNYKNGQANQRGEALRAQLVALLPAKCHAQTPSEAQADPHRGEVPPAPSPFKARASGNGASAALAAANAQAVAAAQASDSQGANAANTNSQMGSGGFKVGDTVRVLIDGWQEAKIIAGSRPFLRGPSAEWNQRFKTVAIEVRRLGRLTAEDHDAGQYDLHDRVQVLVNGSWMEGEIRGQKMSICTT